MTDDPIDQPELDDEKPETIGQLADRLTPGVPQAAYGYVWTLAEQPKTDAESAP